MKHLVPQHDLVTDSENRWLSHLPTIDDDAVGAVEVFDGKPATFRRELCVASRHPIAHQHHLTLDGAANHH